MIRNVKAIAFSVSLSPSHCNLIRQRQTLGRCKRSRAPYVAPISARRPEQRGAGSTGRGDEDARSEEEKLGKKQNPSSTRRSRRSSDSSKKDLEMSWRFQTKKNDNLQLCSTCKGRGRVECSWCHATGVLMLGDRLMCSIEGQSHCLACDNGEILCKRCKGTGHLASWMVRDF